MTIRSNLLILLFSVPLAIVGQENTAPIKWERYRLDDKNVSILLPKLPVHRVGDDPCLEKSTDSYNVYANNVVYAVRLVRSKKASPVWCKTKPFGEETIKLRMRELEKQTNHNGDPAEMFSKKTIVYQGRFGRVWLIDDLKNNRWIELEITARQDSKEIEENFTNSLRFGEVGSAIKIGKGALVTLGDESSESLVSPTSKSDSLPSKPLAMVVASKPKAAYTDLARQNNEQGTVLLRVTFLANGSIGNVDVLKSLRYGLTESAIAAVRQITFLPGQVEGVNVSVVRQVEYGFSIY